MHPIFLLDATFIMLTTVVFAYFLGYKPDKPTTIIPATILFIYAIAYFIIGKYLFGVIELFTGLGWIGLHLYFKEKNG